MQIIETAEMRAFRLAMQDTLRQQAETILSMQARIEALQADAALADLRVNGCSWWSLALALVAGAGVGQVLLMAALVLLAGGDAGARDEHEEDF